MVEDALAIAVAALVPGRFLVDAVPWLKHIPAWVPGASFQVVARETKAKLRNMSAIPFEQVKRAIVRHSNFPGHIFALNGTRIPQADGTAKPSFTAKCLQDIDLSGDVPYQESVIANSAAIMFSGMYEITLSGELVFLSSENRPHVSWI